MRAHTCVTCDNDNDNDTLREVRHPEMNLWKIKKTRNNTQTVAGMNSQIRISESSDSVQHNEANREAKRETQTRKKKRTPEEEVGRYRSSSVTPDSLPNFLSLVRGIRTQ